MPTISPTFRACRFGNVVVVARGIRLVDGAMNIRSWIKDRNALFKVLEEIDSEYEKLRGEPLPKSLDGVQSADGKEYDEAYYGRYGYYEWNEWHDGHAKNLIERTRCKSVLDVACGLGNIVLGFLHNGVDAWGLEISKYSVEHASGELEGRILWGDIKKASTLPKRQFDLVIGYDVFEHVPQPKEMVANFCGLSSRWLHVKVPDIRGLNQEESRKFDPTHVTGRSIKFWIEEFERNGFMLVFDEGFTLLKFDPKYALGATGAPDLHGLFKRRVQYR